MRAQQWALDIRRYWIKGDYFTIYTPPSQEILSQDFTGICPVDENDKEDRGNIDVVWVEKDLPNPEPVNFREIEDEVYLPMAQITPVPVSEQSTHDDLISESSDFNMFSSDDET